MQPPRGTGFLGFRRFAYPHLHHYLLNFASHLAGLPVRQPGVDMAQRVFLGRVVTVLFGVSGIVLTYLIGWRLFSARAGLLAALLLAVTPYHVVYSHLVNVDIPLLSWVLLSFYFALLAAEQRRVAYLVVAAACAGLAGATKYPGVP